MDIPTRWGSSAAWESFLSCASWELFVPPQWTRGNYGFLSHPQPRLSWRTYYFVSPSAVEYERNQKKGKGRRRSKNLHQTRLVTWTLVYPLIGLRTEKREKTSWSTSSLSLLILKRVETLKLFLVKPVSLPTPLLLVPLRRKLIIGPSPSFSRDHERSVPIAKSLFPAFLTDS